MPAVKIDASSGGQVFRNAIGLASLLKKDAEIINIRSQKNNPGLQKQHLLGLNFLKTSCKASVSGGRLRSQKVFFSPKEFLGGEFVLKVGSAGSVCLVLQSLLLPSMLKETRLRVFGGTDVPFAPPANYFQHALFPLLKKSGACFEIKTRERGYFPKGGGSVSFSSKPAKTLLPFNFSKKGSLQKISVFCHSRGLPREITSTMGRTAEKKLEALGKEIHVFFDVSGSKETTGCGLEILGRFGKSIACASALGKKGLPSEKVALHAVNEFLHESDSLAGVDVHTSDQLVPFMALAGGKSTITCRLLSHHLIKSIEVAQAFLPVKFEIREKNGLFFVSVNGAGFFSEKNP